MKLYEIPKGSKIRALATDEFNNKVGDIITFHKLDGAYSLCTVDGLESENIIHLGASTELVLAEDGIYDLK